MPDFSDKVLNRTVTISLDADSQVTHAWQTRLIQVFKDGVAYGPPHLSAQENLEPADIANAIPQAQLLAELNAERVASAAAASKAADDLAAAVEASASAIAALNAQITARDATVATLTAKHDDLIMRATAAVEVLAPRPA